MPWDNRLYRVAGSITVSSSYWDYSSFADLFVAELRLMETPTPGGNHVSNPLRTFNQGGIDCLYAAIGSGDDIIAAGHNCSTGTTITLLAP